MFLLSIEHPLKLENWTKNMNKPASNAAPTLTDPREARKAKLKALRASGANPYAYTYARSHRAGDLQAQYADLAPGTETQDTVSVAGRIMAIRNDGMFIDLSDPTGKIQVFCHKDSMAAPELAKLENFDLGDIIGAKGTIRRTPRGELSVRASHVEMLTKCLLPLPEKYHGLTDIEQRYRQRYVDLIVNEESRDTLRKRSEITAAIRECLTKEWGGLEVETPMLHAILGGATAKPFVTHHNTLDTDFYLRVAPELFLKRLIVGGLADCVFEMNRCFRNEGISPKHNPEFTSAELYKTYTDVNDMMDLTEGLVRFVAQKVFGKTVFEYSGKTIDVGQDWPRKSMCALVAEATGTDFMKITDAAGAREQAKKLGVHVEPTSKWGEVVAAVFEEKVEDKLVQPIHVTDFPLDISPLAKPHRNNPILTERTESYINGWEIANMFTELNDPADQLARFEEQVKAREAGNEEAQMLDDDFVTALEYGLPPTGGWGLGIDRLCMILTGSPNIRDVINFPTLKPLGKSEPRVQSYDTASRSIPARAVPTNEDWKTLDDDAKRFVIVVNEKLDNMGRVLNAVTHAMGGLVGQAAAGENFAYVTYTDADGGVHPSISHYPTIILKAKNSNQIAKIRAEALNAGVPCVDFTDDMTLGRSKEQVASLAAKKADAINYMAMAMFGPTPKLKELTGKLSLYK